MLGVGNPLGTLETHAKARCNLRNASDRWRELDKITLLSKSDTKYGKITPNSHLKRLTFCLGYAILNAVEPNATSRDALCVTGGVK